MIPSIPVLKKRAKAMARETQLSHSAALNRVAADHGFQGWNHLMAAAPKGRAAQTLATLCPGDMLLLAARPGHGKTRFGLNLAVSAQATAPSVFFTLEFGPEQVATQLSALGCAKRACPVIDTSDRITSDHIMGEMRRLGAQFGVVDYLQLLDQRRSDPPVEAQLSALSAFAKSEGVVLCLISQVDRAFDSREDAMPGLTDIRQPNPFSLSHFTKAAFLHNGSFRLQTL